MNFKRRYFSALDFVELFLSRSTNRARQRAGVYAWSGRRFNFPDANFSYKAANAIIQGGCADIVKQAMFNCESVLRGKRSKMVLQVHDEILFQMHNDEAHLLNDLKVAMESAYVYRNMPLTCSISHSLKSWADPVEGLPSAGREPLSHEGPGEVDPTSERRQSNLVRQDSANGYPGTPDFLICVAGKFLALELKRSSKEKPSALQKHTLEKIKNSGGVSLVASPETWDEVEKVILSIIKGSYNGTGKIFGT